MGSGQLMGSGSPKPDKTLYKHGWNEGNNKNNMDTLTTTEHLTTTNTSTVMRRLGAGCRIRRFVFTINNWTEEEYTWLTNWKQPRWMVIGKELGDNMTPHLQGAAILNSQVSFTTLKVMPGFRRAHIEVMHGRPVDSMIYCSKEDINPFQHGKLPEQGKRNDLHEVTERVMNGETLRDLAKDFIGATAIVKYHKGLTILRSLSAPPRDSSKPPTVIWMYGETGSCKTRCASQFGALYGIPWISHGGLKWFDGYDGQHTAIIDDFRAKHCSFTFLLRLLDRYPMTVEFKGGHVNWAPKLIMITCNKKPSECFQTRKEHLPEDVAQLKRRINKVIKFHARMPDLQTEEVHFNTVFSHLTSTITPLIKN